MKTRQEVEVIIKQLNWEAMYTEVVKDVLEDKISSFCLAQWIMDLDTGKVYYEHVTRDHNYKNEIILISADGQSFVYELRDLFDDEELVELKELDIDSYDLGGQFEYAEENNFDLIERYVNATMEYSSQDKENIKQQLDGWYRDDAVVH